ncbi:MAG: LptF/LptG family permease [Bacteroidales bacterium]|jgi:lipopolysaccharide export system permease protein|nr:LptF/LptG family permease [Bacteroidales bacterium]
MKALDKYLFRTYIAPFVLTLLVVLFVFLMQFLWKYIDDLVGKGLETVIILKLVFYFSFTFIPMSMPLAVLLSGLITFGNLAEKNELTAMKSSGIPLPRILRPLSIFVITLCILTFFMANNVMPVASLKAHSLLHDIQAQKLALSIDEGIFYRGIDNYILRIGKKDKDNQTIHDILIYDHTRTTGLTTLTYAKHGSMVMSKNKHYLILTMEDGFIYDENVRYDASKPPSELPVLRGTFKSQRIRFDLSSFQLQRTNEEFYKDSYEMLNVQQLGEYVDTMQKEITGIKSEIGSSLWTDFRYIALYYVDTLSVDTANIYSDTIKMTQEDTQKIYVNAIQLAREHSGFLDFRIMDYESKEKQLWRYEIEWHRKYVLSLACILLFFIGAPLGAIIRKGGLGVPLAVSILIFVIYWALSSTGERMVRVGTLPSYLGMWLSTMVLSPLAVFLVYKVSREAGLSGITNLKQQINRSKIFKFLLKMKNRF